MPYDFRKPDHLPKPRGDRGPADPHLLPRQRKGTTPQLHGRYPDYDVLDEVRHWDEVTRTVVVDRVENVPPIRFFTDREAQTMSAFFDVLLAQDAEPRIPVVNYVDEKLHRAEGDGYQYFDMPDDTETFRIVARGLDGISELHEEERNDLVRRFSEGKLHGEPWTRVNVSRAWSIVTRYALEAFYAHPWAWNEIGFGGPAYPRGYARFGSPHLEGGDREAWEGKPAWG